LRPAGFSYIITAVRVLAVDWGEARLGLAVSDETAVIAVPYRVIPNDPAAAAAVIRAVAETGAEEIVVGLPLTLAGDEGPAAAAARAFAAQIQSRISLPVHLVDERLTTKMAVDQLRAAGASLAKIEKAGDAAAAALILQTYLDLKKQTSGTEDV